MEGLALPFINFTSTIQEKKKRHGYTISLKRLFLSWTEDVYTKIKKYGMALMINQ